MKRCCRRHLIIVQALALLLLVNQQVRVSAQTADPKAVVSKTADAKTPVFRLIHSRTGKEVTLQQMADDLAARDVVYFGELHDNVTGHRVYANLASELVTRRPDAVISMEMFEKDVQGVLNDYLRGRVDEATFLKFSRPWKDYARDYKPLVELARDRKLDVLAANLPRPVASKVASKEGSTSPFLPKLTTAPQDQYWELFAETMKGHPGMEGAVERMYRAQCAKDDAMAESMAGYITTNPHRHPLVIHCNGNFHSDYGLGTMYRLTTRLPLLQSANISMIAVADVAKADVTTDMKKAHYLLIVPAPPKPVEPVKPKAAPGTEKPKTPEAAKSKDKQ
ncbi:MAG: ChaN family lipoprotein [Gemmataceae bacterium]